MKRNSIGNKNRYGRNCTSSSGAPVPIIDSVSRSEAGPSAALWMRLITTSSANSQPRMNVQRRHFVRQYQTRRRATTSSSSSGFSAPYSDARGMYLCASTSTRPRNAITVRKVTSSAQPSDQSCWSVRKNSVAGAVSSATAVAARVSLRHSAASARDSSLNVGRSFGRSSA